MSQIGVIFTNTGPGGFIQTLTGNSGGAVGPTAGNINVIGAGAISVAGNAGTSTLTISVSGVIATQYNEDVGTAIPALGILNINGAHGINTLGAGNVVTVAINNSIVLGDLAVIAAGNNALSATTGDINITAGNLKLPNTNGAGTQGEIQFNSTRFISNFGGTNTFVGANSGNTTLTGFSSVAIGSNVLQAVTTGAFNTAGGFLSQGSITAGTNNASWGSGSLTSATGAGTNQNTAIGASALNTATAPVNNTVLGYNAASNYTTNESNNIIIGNTGTIGDSARIRIGLNGLQTSAFISGIYGVNIGSVATIVSIINTDQLGQTSIVAGAGVTVTPGANTITISATGADLLTYTAVNTTPYVVLATDEFLGVDSSGAPIQINLPNAPATGRVFYVKDTTGSANTNAITVTTVGGVVNIDGATTYVMNTQYAAISLIFTGTAYSIF